MEWGRARRLGEGFIAESMAFLQWLLASLNALRPVRVLQHYTRQRGPLMSAGIGFSMFFSITGLLTTGFSLAGLLLRGQQALLDRVVASVAEAAPGLLKVNGSEGLVDPEELLDPIGLGWTAAVAAAVTVITSLGWLARLREGLRGVQQLPPLTINPILLKLRDVGILVLLGIALVVSSGASLIFGTAAGWVAEFLSLDDAVAGPLTTSIKIGVPLVLAWFTALIMFRLVAGLKLGRRALLEGTAIAAAGTSVLQIFSADLLAGAGRNPLLAPFAIIIGLLIWFNLINQVYLVACSWAAIRDGDANAGSNEAAPALGARRVQPGKVPGAGDEKNGRKRAGSLPEWATARRRGTGQPRQQ